ncbi:hypothetical protein I0C86_08585 [Plantactinospora sp. S1510]|uniref:Uncharacterized protein n=1 Tax=Plantactinospora alkalitolerans TaxID=2789879 RepID=A0ABS0GS87_9ACTN|nr:hypothetical protein [Plantactinospora alkalitolerans]MBF9129040.1 hypothetical protein [Plantactinospora alkalitolerans]
MTDNDRHVWRDEERLPLRDLERAMSSSTPDGQVDDVTGNDAGAESAFGHGPEAAEEDVASSARAAEDRASQATDDQRQYRPSTTGRSGPH